MNYIPTIGLEIHAELKTQSKMFCDCLNDPNEAHPNVNVCPICLAHPGTLPVPNKKAIEAVLLVGMALNGETPLRAKFDRKNYFYPDLPKGYQISQYDLPFVFGGILKGVRLRRIHLEEDTGRLQHAEEYLGPGSSPGRPASLVDFNRAGVPLMELVTEPDIKNSDEAVAFAKELQLILRYLGVSDADMDKGQMRVEANVSIRDENMKDEKLGTKVEVKNINSFRAVHDAIEYELLRQAEVLGKGEKVVQETRGWDDVKHKTVSQRLKEEAHDYRYFPEPDIPPLDMSRFSFSELKKRIPELPQAKRVRFEREFHLKPETVELLVTDRDAATYFEEVISEFNAENTSPSEEEISLVVNYLTSDLRGLMSEMGVGFGELKITPENFADLIALLREGALSSRSAKDMLRKMFVSGEDPRVMMKTEGLAQVSDEAELLSVVHEIVLQYPAAVQDFKKGKENAVQFLVGKAMGALKGKGNPGVLQKLVREALTKS